MTLIILLTIYFVSIITCRTVILIGNTKYKNENYLSSKDTLACIAPVLNIVMTIACLGAIILMEMDNGKLTFPKWFTHPSSKSNKE